MRKLVLVLMFCLVCLPAFAVEVTTGRGIIDIQDGDVLAQNLFVTGQLKGLNNVTFHSWNMSRSEKQEVFIDCTNLTFIDSNLMNVILPEDKGFRNINSSNFYRREYAGSGKNYVEIISRQGNKTIYELRPVGEGEDLRIDTVQITKEVASNEEKINVIDSRKFAPKSRYLSK